MGTILELGEEYLPAVLEGDAEALRKLFAARVSGWGKTYAYEEEMTVCLFSDVEDKIKPYVAFSLISVVVGFALSENVFDGFNCALDLMASLVAASGTTEIPMELMEKFPEIERKALHFGGEPLSSIAAIRGHYRSML